MACSKPLCHALVMLLFVLPAWAAEESDRLLEPGALAAVALEASAGLRSNVADLYLLDGVWPRAGQLSDGSASSYRISNTWGGRVVISFEAPGALAGTSLLLTPDLAEDTVAGWTCTSADVPERFLPAGCAVGVRPATADTLRTLVGSALDQLSVPRISLTEHRLAYGAWPSANRYAENGREQFAISHDDQGVISASFDGPEEIAGALLQLVPQVGDGGNVYWSCDAVGLPVELTPKSCPPLDRYFQSNVASLTLCPSGSDNICRAAGAATLKPGIDIATPKARLVMQDDGNLVVYDEQGEPRWASGSHGNPGAFATFQRDGNLVVYLDDQVLFASQTDKRGANLVVQADGNVVIYDAADQPIWATNTQH